MRGFVLNQYELNPSKFDRFRQTCSFPSKSSKKNGPKMNQFSTVPQRPSPQAPAPRPQKMLQITLVSWDKVSSRLDQMAPHSCPFFVSNFDTFSTTPPKHVWALWDSPGGGKENELWSNPRKKQKENGKKEISFPPRGESQSAQTCFGGWLKKCRNLKFQMGITGAPFGRTELLVPPTESPGRALARGQGFRVPGGWGVGKKLKNVSLFGPPFLNF